MAGQDPKKPKITNILGIVAAQGYMRNLGPGVRHLSRNTQTNYLLGLKNATARYGPEGDEPNSGRARIHYAVTHNKKNLLQNLKARGADLEMTLNGNTPLMLAVQANKPEMVEELCRLGANVNAQRHGRGETALHLAALYGNFRIANLLLDCGADPNSGAGTILTPLQNAAFNGNEQMMALLLRRGGKASINAKSMNLLGQQAAIHMAIGAACLGCVKLLVQEGADLTVQNVGGQTPLQMAEEEFEWRDRQVETDSENPRIRPSRAESHIEERREALNIVRFLEEVTGQRSAALANVIGGRRKRKTRRARRQRKGTRRI